VAIIRKRKWISGGQERVAWVADYFTQDGQRVQKQFKKRKDAEEALDQAKHEIKQGIHTPARSSITVAEAGALWIDQAQTDGLEASTVRQYRQHLGLHIVPLLGGLKLADLSAATVKAFRNKLIKEGRSAAMAKKVLVSLGSILADAQDSNKVARNVVREQSRSRRRGRKQEQRQKKRLEVGVDIPTKDDIRAMLEHAAGRWRPLVVTAIFTGLRASELRGLRWADIDLAHKVIHVRQRADRWNTIGAPKSSAGTRDVPLAPMVVNTLKEWKLVCPRPFRADGTREEHPNLVFPSGAGKVESLANIYRRGLGATQKAAGISKDADHPKYGLHAFRHAAASLFIEQGLPPKRVQAIMGHGSITMTFDTYGHLYPQPDGDQAAMEQLQARLVG
jgi:integrase